MILLLITREMDYTLRVLRALHQNGPLSAAAIAQKENLPKPIALKILKQLRTAGLADSRRGNRGGYRLSVPCEELYLGDLFQALEESPLVNRCQRPGYRCENFPEGNCGLCRELSRIQSVLDAELQKTPLSAIFQEI